MSALVLIFLLSAPFLPSLAIAPVVASPSGQRSQGAVPGFRGAGLAPDSMDVMVSIAVPLRNTAALTTLAQQISDPQSPLFRHFLTFSQIRSEFLPTAAYDSMLGYLGTTGLSVESTSMDSIIVAQGTVAQVREAFGSRVELYTNGTSSYYALAGASTFDGADLYVSNVTGILVRPMLSTLSSKGNVTFTEGGFSAKELQSVYNATSLYGAGYDGSGQTIGILDFYGSPTVRSDLARFDSMFGFPDPTFNIIPVGPYAPNLGSYTGWSGEVSLDVESSHAMAPGAAIDLYVGNGAISLVSAIAQIDQDNNVTSLSQSFTEPEWIYSYYGPGVFLFDGLLVDQFYALGSIEGITFSGSTGDAGGSGFSSGPLGDLGYPATSPFVTALGGTQTYFSGNGSQTSYRETAWSNIGYVPDFANSGGGTGGVSMLEPRPWYQTGEAVPSSYPNGRLNPDLSLQGGVDPGTYIVDAGQVYASGGTSESSPLFAGLVALVASAAGSRLGLLNPFLYSAAADPATRAEVFNPVPFGYNVPWTVSSGYNLVTGLGSLNAGGLLSALGRVSSGISLNMSGSLSGAVDFYGLEYEQGSGISVSLRIMNGRESVTTGSFTASLTTLSGTGTPVSLSYDSGTGNWTGTIPVGPVSGIGYVTVSGTSAGVSGSAIGVVFVGYLAQFSLYPTEPYTTATIGGLPVLVNATDLDGVSEPGSSISMNVNTYSIMTNRYTTADVVSLSLAPLGGVSYPGIFGVNLTSLYKTGPMDLVTGGSTYGYLPLINGIYLQSTEIFSEVAAEPGAVAPGQDLTVVANPFAPVNVQGLPSFETGLTLGSDIQVGSNVTATLVNPAGSVVSTAPLVYGACTQALRICSGQKSINGQLQVPAGSRSGLYTILLTANYSSYSSVLPLNGSYYSQVWVSGGAITPGISIAPVGGAQGQLFQGSKALITADIAYPNGTEVKFGEYTAFVYPASMSGDYTALMHTEYADSALVQLSYMPSLDLWGAKVTLPSPSDAGVVAPIAGGALNFAGPYDIFVTGVSSDGYQSSSSLSAQHPFYIQPYVYERSANIGSSAATQWLALSGSTITGPVTLSNDVFLNTNTVQGGAVTIRNSQIQGTLVVDGAQVTLVGVSGGDLVVNGGSIRLQDSSIGSLALSGSTASLSDSAYTSVSPALPTIELSPATNTTSSGTSTVSFSATVTGEGVSSVTATLDGSAVGSPAVSGSAYTWSGMAGVPDGVHSFVVTVTQTDGLSTTATESFSTSFRQAALSQELRSQSTSLADARSALTTQSLVGYTALALAVVSLAFTAFALTRKRGGGARPATEFKQDFGEVKADRQTDA
jgi:subtilase family serine protease